MPTPSQLPDSASSSTRGLVAVWAASVISGPVSAAGSPPTALEQVARDGRAGVGQRPGLADQGVAAGVLLPAAAVAALAAVPAGDDLHVAELARDAEAAALDLPSMRSAPPMPVPRVTIITWRLALRGAEAATRPTRRRWRRCRRRSAPARRAAARSRSGSSPPRQVRGEDHRGAVGVDEAGGADPDRGHASADVAQQLSTTSTMVSSTTAGSGSGAGCHVAPGAASSPSASTTPPATLVPPMSMPMPSAPPRALRRAGARRSLGGERGGADHARVVAQARRRRSPHSGRWPRPVSWPAERGPGRARGAGRRPRRHRRR